MKASIVLEPFTSADFNRLISWVKTERFMYQFAGPIFTFPITHDQLKTYLNDTARKVYKVVTTDHTVIGHCELGTIDLKNNKARISRVLVANESNRGKGYGKSIIKALMAIAFEELDLHRIDLGVFDFNHGAIICYEQCGFQKEGLLRDAFVLDGAYQSVYNMSILQNEWKALK